MELIDFSLTLHRLSTPLVSNWLFKINHYITGFKIFLRLK